MVKTNQDIIGEQCVRNDLGVLAVSEEDKKVAWESYYENLLNTEFDWDRNSLSQVDPVSSAAILIDKYSQKGSKEYEEWEGCRTFRQSLRNGKSSREDMLT